MKTAHTPTQHPPPPTADAKLASCTAYDWSWPSFNGTATFRIEDPVVQGCLRAVSNQGRGVPRVQREAKEYIIWTHGYESVPIDKIRSQQRRHQFGGFLIYHLNGLRYSLPPMASTNYPKVQEITPVVVVVVDPTPPTCCQQSPAPESCGSQQSLPPGGKERLYRSEGCSLHAVALLDSIWIDKLHQLSLPTGKWAQLPFWGPASHINHSSSSSSNQINQVKFLFSIQTNKQ